jgi:hypothetical protein
MPPDRAFLWARSVSTNNEHLAAPLRRGRGLFAQLVKPTGQLTPVPPKPQ